MIRPLLVSLLLTSLALSAGEAAGQHTVIQTENVRYDYAQVLRVTPVYQTLTATRMEQRCEPVAPAPPAKADSRISRAVGALKDALRRDENQNPGPSQKPATPPKCNTVAVERQFRRPIAYDVDYVYKGAKFRSRLPEDPGNRLRIRIAITPAVPGATSP